MKIIQNLADPSRYSVKCPYAMTPTRVVVHNQGYSKADIFKELLYANSVACKPPLDRS